MLKQWLQKMKFRAIARQLRKPGGMAGKKAGNSMNKANRFLYEKLIELICQQPIHTILEIGFGNGKFFPLFFGKIPGLHISGIDYSAQMVIAAKKGNIKFIAEQKLNLIKGNSEILPFSDNTFDVVFCINVVYFWNNPSKHLQEIKRVLKPGGTFYTVIRTKESMQLMPFTKFGFIAYDEAEWIKLLTENGFETGIQILIDEPEIIFKGESLNIQSHCFVGMKKL